MTPFIITDYADNLVPGQGILRHESASRLSYPEDGNTVCFGFEDDSFWFAHRNTCILELAKKYVTRTPFFDIGGDNGFVSKGLEENDIPTCLVEPGMHGCMNAMKRGLTRIVCSDWDGAGFKKDAIPSVGLFDVIEHIEDDADFLTKVYQGLAPGGVLLVAVPAYQSLWSNEDVAVGHFRRYTLRGLKKKLSDAGFEIAYATYVFSLLIAPILLFRTLPSALGIAKGGAEKNRMEHRIDKKGIVNAIVRTLLSFEVKCIGKGWGIPFGGSCLIVARKTDKPSLTPV